MYIEEEAKKKWCPMIKLPDNEIKTATAHDITCLGSNCMMWRWLSPSLTEHTDTTRCTGYCGLGGNP
jgi:hypothetical protein